MYAFYPTKFKHERRSFFLSISSSSIRTLSFLAVLSGHCHFQQFYQDTVISSSSIRTLSFPAVLSGHCLFQQFYPDTVISSSFIRTLSFPAVLSGHCHFQQFYQDTVISSSSIRTLSFLSGYCHFHLSFLCLSFPVVLLRHLSCPSVSHFLPFCCISLQITVWRSNSAVHNAKLECSLAL